MNHGEIQFGEVAMSYTNSADQPGRAERISILTLEYVQQWLEREMQHIDADIEIDRLQVPPIVVSFETMNDEAIALTSAYRICQALTQAV
jgi:hypothetical protein